MIIEFLVAAGIVGIYTVLSLIAGGFIEWFFDDIEAESLTYVMLGWLVIPFAIIILILSPLISLNRLNTKIEKIKEDIEKIKDKLKIRQ